MADQKGFRPRGYAAGAYRKNTKLQGPLNHGLDEFLASVEAEECLLRHTTAVAGAKEVAGPGSGTKQGHRPTTGDEHELQRRAVRNAIDDARLPRRSRRPHEGLASGGEVVGPQDNPLDTLIDAEEAQKRATLVRKAMKSVVKDGTDKAIVRRLYFGPDSVSQAQVADELGISPSCLSKRLSAVHAALAEFIQREGGL